MRSGFFLDDRLNKVFLDDVSQLKRRGYSGNYSQSEHSESHSSASPVRQLAQDPSNRSITYILIRFKTGLPGNMENISLREFDRLESQGKNGYVDVAISMTHLRYLSPTDIKNEILFKRLGLDAMPADSFVCLMYQFNRLDERDSYHPLRMDAELERRSGLWMYLGGYMCKMK